MDTWNPRTFNCELLEALRDNSELIVAYHQEDRRLMDEHLNSDPYESLKPNQYAPEYRALQEHILTPLMEDQRIRVWHYSRLTDDEVVSMERELEPSTLPGLWRRLERLIQQRVLTKEEAKIIYRDSPFQKQSDSRAGIFCTVDIPKRSDYPGVKPLLESWGGESAYFWLSDKQLAAKLKIIGTPRIVEVETPLRDRSNAFEAADMTIRSWANHLGLTVNRSGHDLFIKDCLGEARMLRVHTQGDGVFEAMARTYPDDYADLFDD